MLETRDIKTSEFSEMDKEFHIEDSTSDEERNVSDFRTLSLLCKSVQGILKSCTALLIYMKSV